MWFIGWIFKAIQCLEEDILPHYVPDSSLPLSFLSYNSAVVATDNQTKLFLWTFKLLWPIDFQLTNFLPSEEKKCLHLYVQHS